MGEPKYAKENEHCWVKAKPVSLLLKLKIVCLLLNKKKGLPTFKSLATL